MKINTPYRLISLSLVLVSVLVSCQKTNNTINSTESLFKAMKQKYDGKWFKNYTFKQLTIRYDAEGIMTDSTMWYESVGYPSFFRIDRDIEQKNYVVYRNDSTYNFRDGELYESLDKPATHLLFKGGLYFMSLDESLEKLKKYNYKSNKFRKDVFKGQQAYVVGDSTNQFWLHAKDFYCLRRIYTTENGNKVDVVYDDFKKLDNGWVEQKVTFYVNGVERLNEFYKDIKTRPEFDPRIYNPNVNFEWYLDY
jgi:outer membrane lipoprotein-sorting protein